MDASGFSEKSQPFRLTYFCRGRMNHSRGVRLWREVFPSPMVTHSKWMPSCVTVWMSSSFATNELNSVGLARTGLISSIRHHVQMVSACYYCFGQAFLNRYTSGKPFLWERWQVKKPMPAPDVSICGPLRGWYGACLWRFCLWPVCSCDSSKVLGCDPAASPAELKRVRWVANTVAGMMSCCKIRSVKASFLGFSGHVSCFGKHMKSEEVIIHAHEGGSKICQTLFFPQSLGVGCTKTMCSKHWAKDTYLHSFLALLNWYICSVLPNMRGVRPFNSFQFSNLTSKKRWF